MKDIWDWQVVKNEGKKGALGAGNGEARIYQEGFFTLREEETVESWGLIDYRHVSVVKANGRGQQWKEGQQWKLGLRGT